MKLPPAIFFDLDDTIISFDRDVTVLWEEVCTAYCCRTGRWQSQQLFDAIDRAAKWYWRDQERHRLGRLDLPKARREVVKVAFQELGSSDMAEAYQIADDFSVQRKDQLMLFPGAQETLAELRRRGIRLALLTNGDSEGQRYKINKFDLGPYFEGIFIEGELGFGKPDQRVYRTALERLSLSPQAVWMVGDNLEWDVSAPQKIGIYGVWNDHRKKGLPEECEATPDRIIQNISELVEAGVGGE